jgi:hypothetical protein
LNEYGRHGLEAHLQEEARDKPDNTEVSMLTKQGYVHPVHQHQAKFKPSAVPFKLKPQ